MNLDKLRFAISAWTLVTLLGGVWRFSSYFASMRSDIDDNIKDIAELKIEQMAASKVQQEILITLARMDENMIRILEIVWK